MHFLRSGNGAEEHLWDLMTILTLQKAVREGSYEEYKEYSRLSRHEDTPHSLRGLLEFDREKITPVPCLTALSPWRPMSVWLWP